jgi:hypothetical protein
MATTTSNYNALHKQLTSASSNQRSVFDNFNPFTKSKQTENLLITLIFIGHIQMNTINSQRSGGGAAG